MRTKAKVLTERLPATPVTPEMRDQIVSVASSRECSVAEVQRDALALFLRAEFSSTKDKMTKSEDISNGVMTQALS